MIVGRVDPQLRREITRWTRRNRTSLNSLIEKAIRAFIGTPKETER